MVSEVKGKPTDEASGVKRGAKEDGAAPGPVAKRKRYESKPERSVRSEERRELMTKAKSVWEVLRPKATGKEKSQKLVGELLDMLRGRIVEFVFRHDGSRIVQWMLAEGKAEQVNVVMQELEKASEKTGAPGEAPLFVRLANDRYGKHLAVKLLRKADKARRAQMYDKYLRGNVAALMKNASGADTLDIAFQTVVSNAQRSRLVVELLFAREKKLWATILAKRAKDEDAKAPMRFQECCESLGDEFKTTILESAAATLNSLIDKDNMLRMNIVHCALKEYLTLVMAECEASKSWEIAGLLAPSLVHLTHTRAGAQVAVTCVKILDAKHRKKAVRSLKGHVRKIAEDEFGNLVLVAFLEWVDDTKLVGSIIFTELLSKSKLAVELAGVDDEGGEKKAKKKKAEPDQVDVEYLVTLCKHKHARMVLLHLLAHRQTRYFNPDRFRYVWEELDVEKFGKMSKKAMDVRREELLAKVRDALKALVLKHIDDLLCNTFAAPVAIGMVKDKEFTDAMAKAVSEMMSDDGRRSAVMESMCGRKTLGTLFKIGGTQFADSVVEQCGAGIAVSLATHESGAECVLHLLLGTEKTEAAKAVTEAEKTICEIAGDDTRKQKFAKQLVERARNLTSFDSVVGTL